MKAWFVVVGMTFNPHKCTPHFGLEPSEVRIRGELQQRSNHPTPENSWSIGTKRATFDNTDAPLRLLLDLIWPKRKQIREFARKKELTILFQLHTIGALGKRNFLLEFSAETIRKISYFGASLDLDMY
jgi:Domain of unknown function (DUF4279)